MMKKIFPVVLVGLLLSGCQKLPENKDGSNQGVAKDVFTTVRDAVTKQMVLKCDYTDEDGEQIQTYIKGLTVRINGKDADGKSIGGLIKDNKFYLWSDEQKKGMVIEMGKMKDAKMGNRPIKSVDDVIAVLEEKKDKCSLSPESVGLLELPSGVEFEDAKGWFE